MAHFLTKTTPPPNSELSCYWVFLSAIAQDSFEKVSHSDDLKSYIFMKIGKIIKRLSNSVGSITKPHCTQRHRTTQLPASQHLGDSSATAPTFSAFLWAWSNPCPWDHVPVGLVSLSHSFHTCAVPVVAANLHQTALSSSSRVLVCLVAGLTDLMVKCFQLLPSPQISDEFPCRHTHSHLQVSWRGKCLVTQRKLAWVWGKKNMG